MQKKKNQKNLCSGSLSDKWSQESVIWKGVEEQERKEN